MAVYKIDGHRRAGYEQIQAIHYEDQITILYIFLVSVTISVYRIINMSTVFIKIKKKLRVMEKEDIMMMIKGNSNAPVICIHGPLAAGD